MWNFSSQNYKTFSEFQRLSLCLLWKLYFDELSDRTVKYSMANFKERNCIFPKDLLMNDSLCWIVEVSTDFRNKTTIMFSSNFYQACRMSYTLISLKLFNYRTTNNLLAISKDLSRARGEFASYTLVDSYSSQYCNCARFSDQFEVLYCLFLKIYQENRMSLWVKE